MAERSDPMSEVRGSSLEYQAATAQEWLGFIELDKAVVLV